MASVGDLFGSIGIGGGGSGGLMSSVATIFLAVCGIGLALSFLYWIVRRKKHWNLKIEFRIPREVRENDDGSISGSINKEWGKGYYDSKQGVVYVKRPKRKAVPMKPFDIKRFLSGSNILSVIQVGIEDYRPIVDDSYLELVDDETGEEAALINAKIDTSEGRAWKGTFEREAKATYSIMSFLQQHGEKLMWGLIIMIILIGQAIVITRLQ